MQTVIGIKEEKRMPEKNYLYKKREWMDGNTHTPQYDNNRRKSKAKLTVYEVRTHKKQQRIKDKKGEAG